MEFEPRAFLAIVMFAGAVWSDLQTRRVANQYWWPFMAMAAILVIGDLLQGEWRVYAIALVVTTFAYLLYALRLFGGADAKGLMVLAWLFPGWPAGYGTVPAMDALVNATVVSLAIPLALLLQNLVRGNFAPAAPLGVPMDLEEARSRHVWPMHHVVDGEVKWKLWQQIGTDMDARYEELRAAGMKRVWVTPKIPFMVPLTLGLLLAVWFGNLVIRVTIAYRF
ncbi:MAG: A24 family peptidase C-terminal domain-containing protein [Thermoplasmatota archaeon]